MVRTAQKDVEDIYALSPLQEGMLYHVIAEPDSSVYFEQFTATLRGPLEITAFQNAWQQIVDRYPELRSLFMWEKRERPLQIIRSQVTLPFVVLDWRTHKTDEKDEQLAQFLEQDRQRGFELNKAPLMRITLIQWTDNTTKLIWSFHHLLLDGWSGTHLLNDLMVSYEASLNGTIAELPPRRRYRDYIEWLVQQDVEQAKNYWQDLLAGMVAPTTIQAPHPANNDHQYIAKQLTLSATETQALSTFARNQRCTVNNLVQLAWALLLAVYSGDDDVLFGVAVSGRATDLAGVENIIGLLINTLPMRVRLAATSTVANLLTAIHAQQSAMTPFEYTSLADIHNWSDIPNDRPLFETAIVFENFPIGNLAGKEAGLRIEDIVAYERTNFPLTLAVMPASAMILQISYSQSRFSDAFIERMLIHLQTALKNIVRDAHQPLSQVKLITPAEYQQIVVDWNATAKTYREDGTIPGLFEEQVNQTPDAIALINGDEQLTYAQLNQTANQIAHYLRKKGVKSGDLVGLSMNRSFELVAGLLGILKLGAAYIPLDPAYPAERLKFMIEDSSANLILTMQQHTPQLSAVGIPLIAVDAIDEELAAEPVTPPDTAPAPDDLFYVLYTSGSTGVPKGVMAKHDATLNRFQWMWETFPFTAGEVCCHKTSISFGDSMWEMFGPLLKGIPAVIIANDDVKDANRFVEILSKYNVSRLIVVPSLLRVLLETNDNLTDQLDKLRFWVTSGEALPVELIPRFYAALPHAKLINLYGSSEVAADVTVFDTRQMSDDMNMVPIGKPIANTQIYLLDHFMNPVPQGLPGEVYIGGKNIAAGYWQQPDLTAERFVEDPFSTSSDARLFRSGDYARHLANGVIEYIGRVDNQVKVRGFRVELGEVEYALVNHPQINQAVVIVQNEHDRLVAFVQPEADVNLTDTMCRDYLVDILPEFMIPATFVLIDQFPLLPSGKINRRQLRQTTIAITDETTPKVAPTSPVEEQLVEIWEKLLGVEDIGIRDNFFHLGGHSLLAIRLFAQINKQFDVKLPVSRLLDAPTIEKLAQLINPPVAQNIAVAPESLAAEIQSNSWSSLVIINEGSAGRPRFFCVHDLNGHVLYYRDLARALGEDQPFYGLQAYGADGNEPLDTSVEMMATRYLKDIRTAQPAGPYYLGGSSLGGMIAFEIAQQLVQQGETVALLAMFDTLTPAYGKEVMTWEERTLSQKFDHHWHNLQSQGAAYLADRAQSRAEWLAYKIESARLNTMRVMKNLWLRSGQELPAFLQTFHREETYAAIYRAYQPQVYAGHITLFRAEERSDHDQFDVTLGWQHYATEDIEVISSPGEHGWMVRDPYAETLAGHLRRAIDGAHEMAQGPAIADLQDQ